MIIDIVEAVNNALTRHIRLHNCVKLNFKRTNQSCSPSKISQSISVEWHTGDREMIKQFF